MKRFCLCCLDRVLVLLTNGANIAKDENDTKQAIRTGQMMFGNKVQIFVYRFLGNIGMI